MQYYLTGTIPARCVAKATWFREPLPTPLDQALSAIGSISSL